MKIIIGALLGAGIGGVIGYMGKNAGGSCPLACNPIGGMIMGTLIGVFIAGGLSAGTTSKGDEIMSVNVTQVQNEKAFDELLKSNKVVLADFYADWCGPCRMVKPLIHQIADEYAGRVAVATINVDANMALAQKYGISSIPDVRVFKDGKVYETFVGARPKTAYSEVLERALKN